MTITPRKATSASQRHGYCLLCRACRKGKALGNSDHVRGLPELKVSPVIGDHSDTVATYQVDVLRYANNRGGEHMKVNNTPPQLHKSNQLSDSAQARSRCQAPLSPCETRHTIALSQASRAPSRFHMPNQPTLASSRRPRQS